MHMNSVPQYLQSEDRQDFERLLDEVLRSAPHRPDLAAVEERLTTAQLRAMALDASALITAAAAAEYEHYVGVRDALRHPALSAPPAAGEATAALPDPSAPGSGTGRREEADDPGAGALAVIAVLAPVLSGTAAVIFLLVGYVLKVLNPGHTLARTLLTTGWVFGAITAAAIVVAAVALLLTALRNGTPADARARATADEELARAREDWRDALRERGILPFLRTALAEPGRAARPTAPPAPTGRIPRLGYDRPGFSSPDDGTTTDRPSYSSPDYSSPDFSGPDFGGPEHPPE